jgi:hypothetical protein
VALLETLAGILKEAHGEIKRLLAASTPQPKEETEAKPGRNLKALRQLINSQLKDHTL